MAIEMAPHGVRVTIIEPGGFRTDFAGSSTTIQDVRAEYDATVGEAARFQRRYNGRQLLKDAQTESAEEARSGFVAE